MIEDDRTPKKGTRRASGIPELDVPDVLVRLGQAAVRLGRMSHQGGETAPVYVQLAAVLDQMGRLQELTR